MFMGAGPRRSGGYRDLALPLLLLLSLVTGCSGQSDPEGAGGNAVPSSEMAPDFTLDLLRGGSVTLSDLRGKVVVIDFWATWCPPCEFQVPELNSFYEDHRASGQVEVLGISVDTDGPDVVGEWTSEKEVRYPILIGDEALARQFGAVGFPTLIIVAPDGSIDSRHVGLIERQELEDALARQMNGDSAST
jgi:peroxiredoxin